MTRRPLLAGLAALLAFSMPVHGVEKETEAPRRRAPAATATEPGVQPAEPTAPARPIRRSADPKGLRPVSPTREPAQGARPLDSMPPLNPPAGGAKAHTPRRLEYRPRIDSALFFAADGGRFSAGPGVLAPRGMLHLKGRGFGDVAGAVQAQGVPSFVLEIVEWSDTMIQGRIPVEVNGAIQRRYTVEVRVVLPDLADVSDPYELPFEHPTELRVLKRGDPEVRLLGCGEDTSTAGDDVENNCAVIHESSTLSAYHEVMSDDLSLTRASSSDSWAIRLTDGWVFAPGIEQTFWYQTEDGNVGASSWPEAGETDWDVMFHWSMSPPAASSGADSKWGRVFYGVRVIVERRMPPPD